MSNEPKPRDSGAFNNVLPEHLEDQLRIAKASGMPSACMSPQGCHDHGCHGACLEDEDAMTDTKTLLSDEQIDVALDAVLRASGSAMRHYTTQKTIDSMRTAMRQVLSAHSDILLASVSGNERKAFEKWASTHDGYGNALHPVDYAYGATRDAWKTWQARATLGSGALAAARAERNKLSAMLDHRNDEATETERMLRAELSAAHERIKELEQDARRYRLVRCGQHWSVINGIGETLRAEELDGAVDAALAQSGEQAV